MTFPKFHDLRSRLAEVARRADEQTPESIRATVAFVLDSLDQAAGRAQPAAVPARPAVPAFIPALYSWLARAHFDNQQDEVTASRFGQQLHAWSTAQPAAVPEAVASLIPKGWVFYSADASIQSSDPRRPMAAMIKRDVDGVQWWLQLTEEEKVATPLYSSGTGMTLTLAIQSAVAALLSAADTEVKK